MPRLRRNEWNFSSNAANRITEVLAAEQYNDSPLGRAEAEVSQFMGNRRLDLVVFDRQQRGLPLITGELKVPWDALGRTPYNATVVTDAHQKASNCGARYFVTWNIKRAVVWRTDDPGVPLMNRVVRDIELVPLILTSSADLSRSDFDVTWRKAIETLVAALNRLFV